MSKHKTLTILPQNSLKRQRPELMRHVRRRTSKDVVLYPNRAHGKQRDDEEPQRVAVSVEAQRVMVRQLEVADRLRVHYTEGGVHHSGHCFRQENALAHDNKGWRDVNVLIANILPNAYNFQIELSMPPMRLNR